MLPAVMMVAWRAAAAILASSSALRPVVPYTCTMRALAARPANSTVALGTVKSSTASTLANSSSGSSVMRTPSLPRPASRPMSWPSAIEPSCSMAPATAQSSRPWMVRTSSRPIRPAAPVTAIFILLMASILAASCGYSNGRPLAEEQPVQRPCAKDFFPRCRAIFRRGALEAGKRPTASRLGRRRRWCVRLGSRWYLAAVWRPRSAIRRPRPTR